MCLPSRLPLATNWLEVKLFLYEMRTSCAKYSAVPSAIHTGHPAVEPSLLNHQKRTEKKERKSSRKSPFLNKARPIVLARALVPVLEIHVILEVHMMIELTVSVSAEPVHNRHPTTSVNLRQTDLSLRLQLPQRLSNASLPSVQDRRTPTPRVTPAPDNLRQPLKKRVPTAPRDLSCHFKRTLSTRKQ